MYVKTSWRTHVWRETTVLMTPESVFTLDVQCTSNVNWDGIAGQEVMWMMWMGVKHVRPSYARHQSLYVVVFLFVCFLFLFVFLFLYFYQKKVKIILKSLKQPEFIFLWKNNGSDYLFMWKPEGWNHKYYRLILQSHRLVVVFLSPAFFNLSFVEGQAVFCRSTLTILTTLHAWKLPGTGAVRPPGPRASPPEHLGLRA